MFLDKLNHYYLLNDTHTENGPKKHDAKVSYIET